MDVISGMISALEDVSKQVTKRAAQRGRRTQKTTDWQKQADSFSVEASVADTLTNLVCWGAQVSVDGESDRARQMAQAARDFMRGDLEKAMSLSFLSGDCIVVPVWTGRGFRNVCISRPNFVIGSSTAGEPLSVAYLIDERRDDVTLYQLVQVISLDESGCRYSTRLIRNGNVYRHWERFPEWEVYNREWTVPNVDHLLIGRYKCFITDKMHPNNVYGVPLCFGASQHIQEIHYLLDQLHSEFALSEKAVFASKSMFVKDGKGQLTLPRSKERMFMLTRGGSVDSESIQTYAPTIQAQPYIDALDLAKKELEKCIGVDSGIISNPPDTNYQNVDSVRKSTRNTQAFIERARDEADRLIDQMVYAWDMLLNFHGQPTGTYTHTHDWSDDYIESMSDTRDSIVAGYSIGATDAFDFRTRVLGESPEIAKLRLEEIKSGRVGIIGEE